MPSAFSKTKLRNSVFSNEMLKEGYVQKQSTGLFKRWQRRFFVTSSHYLKYYADASKSGGVNGAIDLKAVKKVQLVGDDGEWELVMQESSCVLKVTYILAFY
jgi:hypothetical protein